MKEKKHTLGFLVSYFNFRNLLIFTVPISIGVLITIVFNLSQTVEHLSQSIIKRTTDRTRNELEVYFEPVVKNLFIARDLSAFNLYEDISPKNLNSRFVPTINSFPQIANMLVANTNGEEYMLMHNDTSWYNREIYFKGKVRHMIRTSFSYKNGKIIVYDSYAEQSDYDPRLRPWFKLAIENKNNPEPLWTNPYIFFSSKEPGITVSTHLPGTDQNGDFVLAFDVLLTDISRFTTQLKVSKKGKAFIITEDEKVVGLPASERFEISDSVKKYVLKPVSEIGVESVNQAVINWNSRQRDCNVPFIFKSNGENYWCGFVPYKLNSESNLYIGVIVPESDFFSEVNRTKVIIISGFLLVFVLTLLVIRGYNQKRKAYAILEVKNAEIASQKDQIETQKKEIQDSINYSQRIQNAILPPDNLVDKLLPDNFIFYRPKDIVSGDFYWIHEAGDNILFCAADCTGHGVPGAFMSIIGYNSLNRAVREYNHNNPKEILDKLNDILAETLRQHESQHKLKDGMDLALCSLSKDSLMLDYSGAYNSLYIIRNGKTPLICNRAKVSATLKSNGKCLYEIKASRKPIGNVHSKKQFENHNIRLEKEDLIIIYSDGFADQFGGEKGKKFKYRPFKQMLLELSDENMGDIPDKINNIFLEWKKEEEQVDDIIILGVKV